MSEASDLGREAVAAGLIVEVRKVTKTFGRTLALRGVDVDLTAARLNVIVGANGSGKSTLLGVVGGVIRPQGGAVRFRGGGLGEGERPTMSWVSHEALGYPDLTVKENFALSRELNGWAEGGEGRVAYQQFGLERFEGRRLRECSRGQKQRMALAQAIANQPQVLLLDEPTSGLDRSGVQVLTEAVVAEVRRGIVVVVVTHDPEAFTGVSTRRVSMEAGRVARVDG